LPSGELPAVDPELFETAKAAVSALRTSGRQKNGRAGAGNGLALRHGLRSTQLLEAHDVRVWHREQVAAITRDLGGDDQLTAVKRSMVRELARVEVILASLGDELLERGVMTGKGKTRAAATLYLKTLDRFEKVARLIGLEGRTKQVPNPADWLEGKA